MLRVRVIAPFAAFRTFTAGYFRPTAPFITPSAAYGLILNLAGVESRFDDGKSRMTLMRDDIPDLEIALGAVSLPNRHSIYQQLHNYPVGSSGEPYKNGCRGAKYNIQPVRREFLSKIDAYICVRGNEEIEKRIRSCIASDASPDDDKSPRYGIPFLGDNSFMIDTVILEPGPGRQAFWLTKDQEEAGSDTDRVRRMRLTEWIDRADMSKTVTGVYRLSNEQALGPPSEAWVHVGPGCLRQTA